MISSWKCMSWKSKKLCVYRYNKLMTDIKSINVFLAIDCIFLMSLFTLNFIIEF